MSFLTGIHVCVRLSRLNFACGEVCNINNLPGGEGCSGHVFEYAFFNSSVKEDAFDSANVSMRLRGGALEALEALEALFEVYVVWVEGVGVLGLGVSVEMFAVRGRLSPAILGR